MTTICLKAKRQFRAMSGFLLFLTQLRTWIIQKLCMLVRDGGTINVPAVIEGLYKMLKCSGKAKQVENAPVKCTDYSLHDEVRVWIDQPPQCIRTKNVILTPGSYVNDVLLAVTPTFSERINLTISLWSSTYFNRSPSTLSYSMNKWPI